MDAFDERRLLFSKAGVRRSARRMNKSCPNEEVYHGGLK